MKGKPVIEETPDFFMAMDRYVQTTWFDAGTGFEEITKLKNKRFFNHIKQWAKGYFGREVIGLDEIKPVHDNEIIKFMISARGAGNNHANMHVQRLKGFFQYAIGMDWITKNPFMNFKPKHEKVKIKHLTLQDIYKLETLRLNENTVYDVARDLFLFCCYTGLSYADLQNVETKHIQTDADGFKFLSMPRTKTDETAIIPLRKKALELIAKYYSDANYKLFKVPTNQQLNRLLKELASMAALSILPTWHIARKTCATLLISDGLEVALVQRILGHSNMSTTLNHYGKINERPILDSFKKLYPNQ
jgi:integrase/recombinase XerD